MKEGKIRIKIMFTYSSVELESERICVRVPNNWGQTGMVRFDRNFALVLWVNI